MLDSIIEVEGITYHLQKKTTTIKLSGQEITFVEQNYMSSDGKYLHHEGVNTANIESIRAELV